MPYNHAKSQEVLDRYTYMRDNGHTEFVTKDSRCIDNVVSKQWDAADKAKLRRQKRPALVFNKILPGLAAVWAEQLNSRADVGFKPARSGTQEIADVLQKVALQISNNNKYVRRETAVFQRATSGGGRGFLDVRISTDDNIFGEVRIRELNPRNVMIDPDATSYDPDEWGDVIKTKWLGLNDVELLYGVGAANELRGKSGSSNYLGYDFIDDHAGSFGGSGRRNEEDRNSKLGRMYREIERQYKKVVIRDHFVDMISGDTRVIPEDMDRERVAMLMDEYDLNVIRRRTEVIHWCTVIDDLVVFDAESPYKHFTVIPYFPFFIDGHTIGLTENQIDPQQLYNKTKSQELHVLNTTANSGYKVKTGSLQNMTVEDLEERGAETGLVVELDDVNSLEKIQPNQVPTGLDRMSYQAAMDLKEISMAPDSLRGNDRADVAAKAIMAKQVQGASNFASPMENLERTREMLWRNVLDLIQSHYTEERVLHITGNGLLDKDETITINEVTPEGEVVNDLTLGEYSVVVTSIPARKNFEETQFDAATGLREIGIAIPDDIIIEYSPLSRKAEIAQRIREANGEGDPTETQQRMAELELQLKELEARKVDAEIKKMEAETARDLVRAQQESQEKPDPALAQEQSQREQVVAKLRLDKYKIDQEIMFKRQELAFEREQAQQELLLKKAEAAQRIADVRKQEATEPKETTKTEKQEQKDGS